MKILWLVNIELPEVNEIKGKKGSPFGGWLVNSSLELSKKENIELIIIFPDSSAESIKKYRGKNIIYYGFKPINNAKNSQDLNLILNEVKPDIVHIHGTEFEHTLAMVEECKENNIKEVISIQGLVSICANHMIANLPNHVVYGMTLRNLLLQDNIYGLIRKFKKRGKSEVEAIKKTNYVIGRTEWDFACTKQINQKVEYYFCNESLRKEFYTYSWDIKNIERHSIFLSQAGYSIKGLHYVIEAMPLIIKKYPDAKIYVAGKDIIAKKTLKERLLRTYYGKYIEKLIKKYRLENNIVFTGALDENSMCSRYLKSHIFICPSTIENSPNSLGEAMLLGVPSIASNVGGVQDMLEHKKQGFIYQTDASYMIAHYVCKIFEDDILAKQISREARKKAKETHDLEKNNKQLLNIYKEIMLDN